jgi:hypothetical protein
MQKRGYRIEMFKNGLGEYRYRFVVPSILHPGREQRSLNSWATRSSAHRAASEVIRNRAEAASSNGDHNG